MRSWQTTIGTSPPAWMRYAVSVGSVVLAVIISLVLYPYIEPNPFALFITAVAISSWYGGLRPGLLAILLSLVTINYFFIAPLFTFSMAVSDVIRLTIFLIVALLISSLSEARRISETRYAVTLASLGDAVITTDTAARVVFMNAVAEALTGWTLIEARGKMINEIVQLVHMDTRQKVENPVDQVLRDGRVVELANHTILIARDGTERALDDSGAPIRNEAGKLLGVVLVFRDVTARVQAEVERERLLQEAQAAVRMREQFLSIAAHELRTPLTSLLGNAQLMQRRAARDGNMAERERRVINVIVNQARRLDNMIVALLDVSRLETGQLSIKCEHIDIGQLVQRIVDEIQPTLDQRLLELISPDTPLLIDGDALRLEQVFQNLIQNAIKYSDPLAPVVIRTSEQATTICIHIEDQGIGIDPNELPHLFQRFYRSDTSTVQQTAGLGIGLFVVQEIVKLHGGSVRVESTLGVGSTFSVCLPRLP
ncbi:MAG: ATP-binding protein [Roseiflexaceae bacterium]|nr:ATP-binding protein [Roseiflexaceae bacterium]